MDDEKLKKLLQECLPWVRSYYKTRRGMDWKNGQNEEREKWLEEVGKIIEVNDEN